MMTSRRARGGLGVVGSWLVAASCSGDPGDGAASFDGGSTTATTAPTTGGTTSTNAGTSGEDRGGTTDSGADTVATTAEPIFDVLQIPDAGAGDECPTESMYMANDGNLCALNPVVYDRDAGMLTLSVTVGQLFEITDPDVEVVYATVQPGYEGFFTIAREIAVPDVFYFIIADDDFIEPLGACGIEENTCEPACVAGNGGDVCRAFVEDFIPIVANQFIGSPLTEVAFERREAGACCMSAMPIVCNVSATTYTEYIVDGPSGTMHFVFEDGLAFLATMGWSHQPLDMVSGDAEFEFDLCDLPVPAG